MIYIICTLQPAIKADVSCALVNISNTLGYRILGSTIRVAPDENIGLLLASSRAISLQVYLKIINYKEIF